jgi:integrase
VKPSDLKAYYTSQQGTLSPTTLAQYHTILSSALKAAMLDGLVTRNVASIVVGKPRINRDHGDIGKNCWQAHEAHAFIKAAKAAGPRAAAFYALALDSGARKGELWGLQWGDLDFEQGTVTFVRQLIEAGEEEPVYGPIKNHGLVFAKEWGERWTRKEMLGQPLQANNIGEREFSKIIKAAGVRRISIHGLRHTSATLLKAGVAAHVVQRRLGHKRIEMTLGSTPTRCRRCSRMLPGD